MYRCTVGSSLIVKEMFVSSLSSPLLPDTTEPIIVALFDDQRDIIFKVTAMPGTIPGEWLATITVPVLQISSPLELYLLWYFKDSNGDIHNIRDTVLVSPSETRDSEWVILDSDDGFAATFPFEVNPNKFKLNLYRDNDLIFTWDKNGTPEQEYDITATNQHGSSLYLNVESLNLEAELKPLVLLTSGVSSNAVSNRAASWLFVVNPSIISATMALEEYINKARIKNIIPELDYRMSDMLLYLERGLSLFNSYPPQITGFTGKAMAGSLLDCWLLCSSYYILTAQVQAEGATAFDFSGQSVTLNVDRTQAIESAIGRLEGLIDSTVKPFKKTLIKSGVTGGDGNIKGALSFGRSFGRLILTNNPLSRAACGGGVSAGSRIIPNFPIRRGVF